MKILIALPGLHRVNRGAEVAFESVAAGLAGEFDITAVGSGAEIPGRPYRYLQAGMVPREKFENWPKFPPLRSEFRWEELTFAWSLRKAVRALQPDLTVTCSYPFVSWILRGARDARGRRARHVFVTQNGDHPARRTNSEYRLFRCDGLVCTNPDFYEFNKSTWRSALVPNGVDVDRFTPGPDARAALGLPSAGKVVVMASALIPSKNVALAIRAVARLEGVTLAVAGDGPCRDEVDGLARELLGPRYFRMTLAGDKMPGFYRSGDAFLHLSREESFGNVYIEAMACGTPVVAHDYGTTRWILGDRATLLDTTNPEATAQALRGVLAGPPPDRQALHNAARERFSWPVVTSEYARFFREILEAKK
ncbi:MAG: glycosyltransferase family 4 protein [Verrucomicrobiae bacterium]